MRGAIHQCNTDEKQELVIEKQKYAANQLATNRARPSRWLRLQPTGRRPFCESHRQQLLPLSLPPASRPPRSFSLCLSRRPSSASRGWKLLRLSLPPLVLDSLPSLVFLLISPPFQYVLTDGHRKSLLSDPPRPFSATTTSPTTSMQVRRFLFSLSPLLCLVCGNENRRISGRPSRSNSTFFCDCIFNHAILSMWVLLLN